MSVVSISEAQRSFLRYEALSASIIAAFGRARIYTDAGETTDKEELRRVLRDKAEELWPRYRGPVSDGDHERNIAELVRAADGNRALIGNHLRLGITQKLLNLFLKYLWCLGEIPPPPHCPFDARVIRALGPSVAGIVWTKLDCFDGYRRLVAAARSKAGEVSIAAWELRTFNDTRPSTAALEDHP